MQKRSVADMEGTLIRNLSDHSGNNLLHVMAVFGHLAPLAWLLTSQQVLVDALHDENKFGLTPLVCAIKVCEVIVVLQDSVVKALLVITELTDCIMTLYTILLIQCS